MIVRGLCFLLICFPLIAHAQPPCDQVEACFGISELGGNNYFFESCSDAPAGAQYSWDFGDGGTSTLVNGVHEYQEEGSYIVCLTVTWENCIDSTCATVFADGGINCMDLDAFFTWEAGSGNTINFSGGTNFPADVLIWYFEPGAEPVYGAEVSHTFSEPGAYYPCMTAGVWDAQIQDTCWTEDCEFIYVGIADPCEQLTACFTATDEGDGVFIFENCSVTPDGGGIMSYFWNFGDNSFSSNEDPDHFYASPGTYEVCLSTSYLNCNESSCTTIIVGGGSPCDSLVGMTFDWIDLGNGMVIFSADADAEVNGYTWYFGDEGTGTGDLTEHAYEAPGEYNVCVVAWYPVGQDTCWTEACEVIDVGSTGDQCNSLFSVEILISNNGDGDLVFTAVTNMDVSGVLWDFGDEETGSGSQVEHTYDQAGEYQVCVEAWYWNELSQDTCWADACQWIAPFSVGMAEAGPPDRLDVHPVPAHDLLIIDGVAPNNNSSVQLFSIDGRLVKDERVDQWPYRLQLHDAATGVHLLKLTDGDLVRHVRVLIE